MQFYDYTNSIHKIVKRPVIKINRGILLSYAFPMDMKIPDMYRQQ